MLEMMLIMKTVMGTMMRKKLLEKNWRKSKQKNCNTSIRQKKKKNCVNDKNTICKR
jgi:hypothetical protein